MLTLMAAWQAMDAAMRARIFSRFSDCSSRENLVEQFVEHLFHGGGIDTGGSDFHRYAARAEGFGFESVVLQFVGDFGEHGLLRGRSSSTIGMSRRWLSTFCAARCFKIRSNKTRSWATC